MKKQVEVISETKPTIEIIDKAVRMIEEFDTIKGCNFVAIKNYEAKNGQVSNYVAIVGFDYVKMLKKDLTKIQNFDYTTLVNDEVSLVVAKKVHTTIVNSLIKRTATEEQKEILRKLNDQTIKKSDAMNDAYITIAKGVKYNKNTKELYFAGVKVHSEVLVVGECKNTNSRLTTIVRRRMEKAAKLNSTKYRTLFLKGISEVNMKNEHFTF